MISNPDLPSPKTKVVTEHHIGSTAESPAQAAGTVLSDNGIALAAIATAAFLAAKGNGGK
ncbi:hypothetical protein [Thermoleptolyngbya sp.]